MVRRRDYYGVEIGKLEQVLDIVERVTNAEAIRERAGFRAVVVTDGRELGAPHLRQNWKVRKLRDRTRADDSNPNPLFHCVNAPHVVAGRKGKWRRRETAVI